MNFDSYSAVLIVSPIWRRQYCKTENEKRSKPPPLSEILTQNKDANWLKINYVLSFLTHFCVWKQQFKKCCYVSKYLNIWFDLTLSSLTYLISLIIIIVVSDGVSSKDTSYYRIECLIDSYEHMIVIKCDIRYIVPVND